MIDTASAATALFDGAPATPAPDAAAPAPAPATPAAATPPAADSPFLQIDDRTKYATRDDAAKGWKELNEVNSRLRPFEVLMKPVEEGGFGLTAEQAVAHLDAYANKLAAEKEAQATPAAAGTRSDAATVKRAQQGDPVAYESLTPEWKAHVDYLTQLGYAKKDDITGALKPLQDQVNSLSQASDAQYVETVNNAVAHGHTLLSEVMKDAGISADADLLEQVGNVVGSAIDRDSYDASGRIKPGSLADRFIKGNADTRKSIIKEQYGIFTRFSDASKKAADAKYAADKTAAQSQSPRIPPSGGSTPAPAQRGRLNSAERAQRVTDLIEAART